MLIDFFVERKIISFDGCIAQLFFLHFAGASEMFLLTVMAFDLYTAICRPLHYATIMNQRLCCILVALSWRGGFIHSIIQAEEMKIANNTVVTEFILLGLTQSQDIQLLVFVLILIFYLIILPGNFLIIFTIRSDPGLTAPLYFFLGNLAFLDASYSFIVAPRMLVDFFSEKKVISYRGCITQLFFLHFLGGGEGLLLVVMAFDRYIAICRPLHCSTVMNPRACYAMMLALWLGGFVHSIIQVVLILRLPFCGPNQLDNFFCDVRQVIKLACTDMFVVELLMVFNSGLMTLLCFLGLLASYAVILCHVRRAASEGKNKAMSMCTTRVIIILLMFGPAIFIYMCPFRALPADKMVSLFHTVIFPLMNPMIYTLRNQEVKTSMKRLLSRHVVCQVDFIIRN
eukprot:XP_011544503.1 olfactory receptor 4N4 isoform X1 [Homo sapiens]